MSMSEEVDKMRDNRSEAISVRLPQMVDSSWNILTKTIIQGEPWPVERFLKRPAIKLYNNKTISSENEK